MKAPETVVTQGELLPCPFCGGDEIYHAAYKEGPLRMVECQSCGANVIRTTESAVIAAWNHRPPPLQSGEIGDLVEKLRGFAVALRNEADLERENDYNAAATMRDVRADEMDEAAATITALQAELASARKVVQTIAAGDEPRPLGEPWRNDGKPSKNDKCVHERWMYDDCGECIAEGARAWLTANGGE